MRKTKGILMIILMMIFTEISVSAAPKEVYRFSMDGYNYTLELPKDWTFKSQENKHNNLDFYKGEQLAGGFLYEGKEINLKEAQFVEEINTALGKAKIYVLKSQDQQEKMIIYGQIQSEKSQCAMYVYSDEKDIRKNIFILKMLLININNN